LSLARSVGLQRGPRCTTNIEARCSGQLAGARCATKKG
jgi:hypothetical protein